MSISRSQMYRQLKNKGGIINAVPRQGYFLGGIGDAIKDTVKGVAKGITGILKSDLGKAALIGGGLFGIPGTQFGGLLGKGSIANIIGQKAMTQAPGAKGTGLKGFFQNILGGEKTLGTTAKVFAGGTALGAVLEAAGLGQEEQEQLASTRNIDALKGYLRKGYKNLNPIGDKDPEQYNQEVEAFVEENTREYAATGGRIGFESGTPKKKIKSFDDIPLIKGPYKIKYDEDGNRIKPEMPRGKPFKYNPDLIYKPEKMPYYLTKPLKKAMGGRIGYAKGTEEIVDQASGIMGLPQRTNQAGVKELDLRETGGFIPPVGVKEKADDIPAMLSNNEFVFTADAVRGMGNGDVNKGAQRLYDQMKMLEKGGIV
jgi:hypothetical protein